MAVLHRSHHSVHLSERLLGQDFRFSFRRRSAFRTIRLVHRGQNQISRPLAKKISLGDYFIRMALSPRRERMPSAQYPRVTRLIRTEVHFNRSTQRHVIPPALSALAKGTSRAFRGWYEACLPQPWICCSFSGAPCSFFERGCLRRGVACPSDFSFSRNSLARVAFSPRFRGQT